MIATFVINLDRQIENFSKVQEELGQFCLHPERVSAIEARNLGDTGFIPPVMKAIFESHRKVARIVVDRKLPIALVLEDDARPYPHNFLERLKYAIESVPEDADIVNLHSISTIEKFGRVDPLTGSTAALLLTFKGALKLLDQECFTHIDLQTNFTLIKYAHPNLFYTDETSSTNVTHGGGKCSFLGHCTCVNLNLNRCDITMKTCLLRNPLTGHVYNVDEVIQFIIIILILILVIWRVRG